MNLSIIVPTCGRRTLARTLQSIQLAGATKDDEVIVVGDGPQPAAKEICEKFSSHLQIHYFEHGPSHCFGNAQRDYGMRQARKELLAFMDDDDEYLQNSFNIIRVFANHNPGKILICQMKHRSLGVVWKVKKYEEGIGTQNVILPNRPELLSEWTCKQVPEHDYMGDFYFFKRTIENWPNKYDDIVWVEHVIATHHMPWVQQENIGNWEPL